ncbi:hypothetical protein KC353_g10947, partial [Hortaea werneckii]
MASSQYQQPPRGRGGYPPSGAPYANGGPVPDRGHPAAAQRDAAFSNIFGAQPPPGRSQTMTSATPPMSSDRAATMSSATAQGYMPRAPPVRPGISGGMNGGYPMMGSSPSMTNLPQ